MAIDELQGHQQSTATGAHHSTVTEQLLSGVLNSSHDGIMAFDALRDSSGRIIDFVWTVVNPAAEKIVTRDACDIIGKRLLVEMPGNLESGLFDIYVRVVETAEAYVNEHHYAHEGLDHWFLTTAVPLDNGFAVTFRDISEQKRLQTRLEHQIAHDQLTSLPNRVMLEQYIDDELDTLAELGGRVTVMFLDLDRFKVVNDTLGHAAGDELLRQFSQRITDTLHRSDIVARVGGDEFVVLVNSLESEDIERTVARLIATCDAPFLIENHEVFVGVAVGVARTSSPRTKPAQLIADADAAMYEAKRLGGNRAEIAPRTATKPSIDRVDLEADLRCAIERGQLRVAYQPDVDCRTNEITGAEALVRWQHPERGLLPPGQFLPIAEATGLIKPIGSWVLDEAVQQLADWTTRFPALPLRSISVNASAQQLTSSTFPDDVASVLAARGLTAEQLCVEVTETALIRDPEAAKATLQRLSAAGVVIALDDFGTGYSPITYLRQFPVDIIKIDRSFISGPSPSAHDVALIDAVIGLAAALDKNVTAEGVENSVQLERVRAADHYQGFYFSKPLDADAFEALIVQHHQRSAVPS